MLDEVDRAEPRKEGCPTCRRPSSRTCLSSEDYKALLSALQDQLDRAVTDAFSGPFLLAAALALGGARPGVGLGRGEPL